MIPLIKNTTTTNTQPMIQKLIDMIAKRFKCNHHIKFGVDMVDSFDKELLASTIVSLQLEGLTCTEIRQSLSGYYYSQIVPNTNH